MNKTIYKPHKEVTNTIEYNSSCETVIPILVIKTSNNCAVGMLILMVFPVKEDEISPLSG